MTSSSIKRQSITIPDSDKSSDYHEQRARQIISNTFTASRANNYELIAELEKFAEQGSTGELTEYLQKAADGTDLPAYWISTNTIRTKLDLLQGELEERGYTIKVRAMNKEAVARKIEEKERLRVERRLRQSPSIQQAQQMSGIILQKPEYIPQTDKELDEYIDLSFKDKTEIIMGSALKWCAKRNHWDDHRVRLWRDVLTAGYCAVGSDIYRGVPRGRRISPREFIFDPDITDDMASDATYFGEVYYMPIADVAEQYGISREELEEVRGNYESFLGSGMGDVGFSSIDNNRWKWFQTQDNQDRVMVIKTVWRDLKGLKHKYEVNEKYGSEHLQQVDKTRPKDKVIVNDFMVWHQCTIIGGQFVREWGECPNQPRELSDLSVSEPPYKMWIPNYNRGRVVSKVEQLAGLQLSKDIVMYNLQLDVATSGGQGIIYDLAMLPEGFTQEQVISYIKTQRIAFVNSKEYQLTSGGAKLFDKFDLSLTTAINSKIAIMEYLESEMSSISGVSPERQGTVQGASQAVGVTNAALFQSNLITAPYFRGFERFCSRHLRYQAKLVKIAWAGKEVFAPIIGDAGVDFLREHIDLDLDEFDTIVESLPPIFRDRQKLEEFLYIVVQSDPEFVDDALAIMMEPDTEVAVRRFQRRRAVRKLYLQQLQQSEAEQDRLLQEKLAQAEQEQHAFERGTQFGLQDKKNQGNLQKTALTGRVKLGETRVKALADILSQQNSTEKVPA